MLEVGPDSVGDASFEVAEGFPFGFPSSQVAVVEASAFALGAGDLGEGGGVDDAVELAVAAAVQSVPHGAP